MSEGNTSPDIIDQIPQEQSEYETAVGTMEELLTRIVNQIKDKVRAGEYELLIGDDTSARLPALVLRNVINHILETEQRPGLDVKFVQGGRNIETSRVQARLTEIISQTKLSGGKKALLITDFVRSGDTLKRYTDILGNLGIKFDIATLDMEDPESIYRNQGVISPDSIIYSGNPHIADEKHDRPGIFARASLTGLKRAYKPGAEVEALRNPVFRSDTLAARRDVQRLSNKILQSL